MLHLGLARSMCIVAIAALTLNACGGSGKPRKKTPANGGALNQSTLVRGVVSQTAPNNLITVAGRAISANNAVVTENGAASANNVGVGMTVTALVDPNNTAQAIDVTVAVQGPVETINPTTNTINLLGQVVNYDTATVFNGTTAATLTAGQVIKVSGSQQANGNFTATRIDLVAASFVAGTQLQVTGKVQFLNPTGSTFLLGSLVVNYASAPALTPAIADGMKVAAGGTALPVANTFTATELTAITATVPTTPTTPTTPVGGITVSGNIASIDATTGVFVVTGQRVRTTTTTSFVNGTATDIKVGANVTVTGTTDATDATLMNATSVTFAAAANSGLARISAPLESVDATANTLTVLGITVSVTATTLLASEDEPDSRPVTLASLPVGATVKIIGSISGDTVTATAVQLDEDASLASVTLVAPVSSVGTNELTIMGIKIVPATTATTPTTSPSFSDFGVTTNLTTAFASVQAGNLVIVRGSYANGVLTATQLSLATAATDDDDADEVGASDD